MSILSHLPVRIKRPLLFLLVLSLPGFARSGAATGVGGGAEDGALSVPARTWAADASANELAVLEHPGSYLRYRIHTNDDRGNRVRDVIESRDGSVARLIMKEGRPLTPEEDRAEQERLRDLQGSPSAYARHIKSDMGNKKTGEELLKLLPDAMLYSYAAGQPQSGTDANGPEVVIDFKPNPAFSPPSLAAQALTGLMGRVWIDEKTHRMVRMEGSIFQAVNFGFGMLAHVYPGGTWSVDQRPVFGERWALARFTNDMTVRALLVKTMKVQSDTEVSDFESVAKAMSYQEAIGVLLATPLPQK